MRIQMRYRRANIPGVSYFFTVNLADRNNRYLVDHVDRLRAAVQDVKHRYPFHIDAMVVLPEHLHAILTLPPDDADFSMRWGLIKAGFSRALPKTETVSPSRQDKGERGIWQRRFWEHLIRDDRDYEQHMDYIHYNPVKHGYVDNPIDWPHSSIHRYVRQGVIPKNWASTELRDHCSQEFGERS